jgi:hypothetical protein
MKKILLIISLLVTAAVVLNSCSKDGGFLGSSPDNGSSTGTGGSLARFTIAGNYLYLVDERNLITIDISNPQSPQIKSKVNVGMDIETIFPYRGNLFIGSATAMYIFSLNNPENPVMEGMANHMRACDPAVAAGNTAYVTVRSSNNGSPCGGNLDALIVYDVSNLSAPYERKRFTLSNPHGLGIKDGYLYVCDGNAGLRTYQTDGHFSIEQKDIDRGYFFKDVIPYQDMLICMVDGGIVIYDIGKDPLNPQFVTKTF